MTKFNFDDPIAEGRKLAEEAKDYPKLSTLQFENFRYANPEQVLNHIDILFADEALVNRQYNDNNISIFVNRREEQVIREPIPEKEMDALVNGVDYLLIRGYEPNDILKEVRFYHEQGDNKLSIHSQLAQYALDNQHGKLAHTLIMASHGQAENPSNKQQDNIADLSLLAARNANEQEIKQLLEGGKIGFLTAVNQVVNRNHDNDDKTKAKIVVAALQADLDDPYKSLRNLHKAYRFNTGETTYEAPQNKALFDFAIESTTEQIINNAYSHLVSNKLNYFDKQESLEDDAQFKRLNTTVEEIQRFRMNTKLDLHIDDARLGVRYDMSFENVATHLPQMVEQNEKSLSEQFSVSVSIGASFSSKVQQFDINELNTKKIEEMGIDNPTITFHNDLNLSFQVSKLNIFMEVSQDKLEAFTEVKEVLSETPWYQALKSLNRFDPQSESPHKTVPTNERFIDFTMAMHSMSENRVYDNKNKPEVAHNEPTPPNNEADNDFGYAP